MTETTKCICGSPLVRQSFSPHFDSLKCELCKSRTFVPKLGQAERTFSYDSADEKYGNTAYLHGRELRWAHTELLRKKWAGKKVLEIGCFNGFFLNELRADGASVYGFDVNEAALTVGRTLFYLEGRLHSSMDALVSEVPFDVILCIDVVEHVHSPEAFLTSAARMLGPKGQIVIAGPTIERCFHDKSDYPPHHKWWFSRRGLAVLLNRTGYVLDETSVQRDGVLFLRNLIGKCIHGLTKREFYGEGVLRVPRLDSTISRFLYTTATGASRLLLAALGLSYCSTIMIATLRSVAAAEKSFSVR